MVWCGGWRWGLNKSVFNVEIITQQMAVGVTKHQYLEVRNIIIMFRETKQVCLNSKYRLCCRHKLQRFYFWMIYSDNLKIGIQSIVNRSTKHFNLTFLTPLGRVQKLKGRLLSGLTQPFTLLFCHFCSV